MKFLRHGKMPPLRLMDLGFRGATWELACDEALLEACEGGAIAGVLRFWEADTPFVVLGYANRAASEVNLPPVVPVFRRCSGGGSVVQGAGCLNYSLVLPIASAVDFATITDTNCFIMRRNFEAVASLLKGEVRVQGYTDLTLDGKKFSGNSQRRKNRALLFHGTFLLRCDFALMEKVLRAPPREPEYRKGRKHSDFLTTLPLTAEQVKQALARTWNATDQFTDIPQARIEELVASKYSRPEWNFRT